MNNLVALIFVSILVLVALFGVYRGDFSDTNPVSDIIMGVIKKRLGAWIYLIGMEVLLVIIEII